MVKHSPPCQLPQKELQFAESSDIDNAMRGKPMPEYWLRCSVHKGMFSDERLVKTVRKGFLFCVHQSLVEGEVNEHGRVKIRLCERGDGLWAILPTEDSTVLEVSRDELEQVNA